MNDQTEEKKDSSKALFIVRVVGTLLSLGLLVLLITQQGWDEFLAAFKRVPPSIFLVSVGLILGSRVCVTLRWLVLLRFAKAKINFWQAFRLMFMGNFASNFLPSTVGGDIVRLAGVMDLGVDAGIGAASLVLDRLTGMAGMASFGPYGLWLIAQTPKGTFVPGGVSAMTLVGLKRLPGVGWLVEKAESFVRSLISSSIGWLRRPWSLVLALFCTYGHMLFSFLISWVFLRSMGEPISFLWVGGLWSLSYFISLVPVSINGLGLQEVSITMLYSQFGGVSLQSALALATLIRLLFLLASLPGVLFLPDILRPLTKISVSRPKTKAL